MELYLQWLAQVKFTVYNALNDGALRLQVFWVLMLTSGGVIDFRRFEQTFSLHRYSRIIIDISNNNTSYVLFSWTYLYMGERGGGGGGGGGVLIEALRYKPRGRGFDSQWGN
jgi:hypothetical protein